MGKIDKYRGVWKGVLQAVYYGLQNAFFIEGGDL